MMSQIVLLSPVRYRPFELAEGPVKFGASNVSATLQSACSKTCQANLTTSFHLTNMSRPKIDEQSKRLVQVNIRLTTEENDKVNEYAAASGLSPANWIREKVFTGKNPAVRMSPLDTSIYQELKRIGVNLNQAAHKLNQGDFPRDIQELQIQLIALLHRTLKAIVRDGQHDQG